MDRVALTRILIHEYCLRSEIVAAPPTPSVLEITVRKLAASFWTEHSSRASLPTFGRAIGVDKAITDKLVDWSSKLTTSDEYIRCGREDVVKTQVLVAQVVMKALDKEDSVGDPFGEKWVLCDLADFISEREVNLDKREVSKFIQGWIIFQKTPHGQLPLHDKIEIQRDSDSSDEELAPKPLQIPKKGAWVITSGRGTATLHIVGGCFRKPGNHYSNWVPVFDPVPVDKFRRACKGCFKRGYPIVRDFTTPPLQEKLCEGMPEARATEETSDSSSSSSA